MISIKKYTHKMRNIWDEFISISNNGTIFQKQSFLDYHIDRKFINRSLMFYNNKKLVAVFPATVLGLGRHKILYSHPGASFGGLILLPGASFSFCSKILASLESYCKKFNFSSIVMINTPSIYYKQQEDSLVYLLLWNKYYIGESYISHYVDLNNIQSPKELFNKRKQRYISGLLANNKFSIKKSTDFSGFFRLLAESKKLFRTQPTHSLNELKKLYSLHSDAILLFITKENNVFLGGVLFFLTTARTCLVFYNVVKSTHKNSQLAMLQLYCVMDYAKTINCQVVDLGVSHTPEAKNPYAPKLSLINFKEQLGARGVTRVVYKKDFL